MDDEGDSSAGGAGSALAVLEASSGEPYTSHEVADALGCARTTAYKKLRELADAGRIRTKKVGARGRVWWVPLDGRAASAVADSRRDGDEDGDRNRDYEAVLASERQLRAVFEEAFDAILIADDEARLVEVNPAACELFGLPREALLGRTAAEFATDGYDFEEAWADFQESDLDRGLFPLERPDGGRRLVEFAATPNILPGRHLSVLRDVTERRETRVELERERERSERYQRTLAADTVVELEFETDADDVFGALSRRFDCRCEFEGATPTRDGGLLHYVTVSGTPDGDVLETAQGLPSVSAARVVHESDGTTLLEVEAARSPVRTLAEAGANPRATWSERGVTTVVAETGVDADLQRLVNAVTATYPDATVVAKRTLDRPVVTTRQYREALAASLTERQTETLHAAYLAGYYEWPRRSRAEEVASATDVATSTWLRHLRLAESKLVRWFFEELEA